MYFFLAYYESTDDYTEIMFCADEIHNFHQLQKLVVLEILLGDHSGVCSHFAHPNGLNDLENGRATNHKYKEA